MASFPPLGPRPALALLVGAAFFLGACGGDGAAPHAGADPAGGTAAPEAVIDAPHYEEPVALLLYGTPLRRLARLMESFAGKPVRLDGADPDLRLSIRTEQSVGRREAVDLIVAALRAEQVDVVESEGEIALRKAES